MQYGHNLKVAAQRFVREMTSSRVLTGLENASLPFISQEITFTDKEIRSVNDKAKQITPKDKLDLSKALADLLEKALNSMSQIRFQVVVEDFSETEKGLKCEYGIHLVPTEDNAHKLFQNKQEYLLTFMEQSRNQLSESVAGMIDKSMSSQTRLT